MMNIQLSTGQKDALDRGITVVITRKTPPRPADCTPGGRPMRPTKVNGIRCKRCNGRARDRRLGLR